MTIMQSIKLMQAYASLYGLSLYEWQTDAEQCRFTMFDASDPASSFINKALTYKRIKSLLRAVTNNQKKKAS